MGWEKRTFYAEVLGCGEHLATRQHAQGHRGRLHPIECDFPKSLTSHDVHLFRTRSNWTVWALSRPAYSSAVMLSSRDKEGDRVRKVARVRWSPARLKAVKCRGTEDQGTEEAKVGEGREERYKDRYRRSIEEVLICGQECRDRMGASLMSRFCT